MDPRSDMNLDPSQEDDIYHDDDLAGQEITSRSSKRSRTTSNASSNGMEDHHAAGASSIVIHKSSKSNHHEPLRTSSLPSPTLQLTGHTGSVYGLAYSPTGRILCSSSFDMTCMLWDHTNGYMNYNVLKGGHTNAILDVAWCSDPNDSDDSRLVTCGADKTIQLWDTLTGTRIRKWKEHTGIVNACTSTTSYNRSQTSEAEAVAGGSVLVASASDDGTVRIWDVRQKKSISVLDHQGCPVTAVAITANGESIYTGGLDNLIYCYDLREMARKVYALKGHSDTITCLSLHPDMTHVLSNSMDHTLKSWDIRPFVVGPNRLEKTFLGHVHNAEKGLLRCSWSMSTTTATTMMVSAGSADRHVHIWDVLSTQELYLLPGHKGCVNTVIFHPHENIIASGGSDKHIYVGELS